MADPTKTRGVWEEHPDSDYGLWKVEDGSHTVNEAWLACSQLQVLLDIRRELRKLNAVFSCPNFVAVPGVLRDIKTIAANSADVLLDVRDNTEPKKSAPRKRAKR